MKWKNWGESEVYKNPWFEVRLADVELPDGRHLEHYLIRQRNVALAAAVNDRHEVLLLWRHRFVTDTWGWELPAGVIADGETPEEAAAREMLEETGWNSTEVRHLVTLAPQHGLTDALHHVYLAEKPVYMGYPEDDFESSKRQWVPLEGVPDIILSGEIKDSCAATALLLLYHQRIHLNAT